MMFNILNRDPMHRYLEEMYKKYHSYATWPIYQILNLGDVGVRKKNLFTRLTTLKDLDIEFSPLKTAKQGSSVDLLYTSDAGVETCGKFGGNANPPSWLPSVALNADMSICIKKANSIYFNAVGITICSIVNKNALGWKLIERFEQNSDCKNDEQWDLDWMAITDLQYAKRGTFVLSNGKECYIALKADSEAVDGDIAKLNCGFSIKKDRNVGIRIVAKERITPLFNGIKLRKIPFQEGLTFETSFTDESSTSQEKLPYKVINDDLIICENIQFQPFNDVNDLIKQ